MLYYFALLSVLLAILLSIYNWRVNKNTLYIAGILVILSAHGLTHYFTDPSQSDFSLALLYGTLSPFWLLPGPLLYFYFRSVLFAGKSKWSATDLVHFIPFVIQLINIFPYLISSFDYKLQVAHAIHQDLNSLQTININSFYSFKASLLSRPVLMLAYLVWCSFLLLREKSSISSITRYWLIFFIASLSVTTLSYLYIAFNLFNGPLNSIFVDSFPIYFSSGIAYIALPIILITFFPEVLFGIQTRKRPHAEERKNFKKEDDGYYRDLAKKIERYCHKEKPYLQTTFEIADVAKALQVSIKHIPIACKFAYNKKFTEVRSQMRVEHARLLLENGLTNINTIEAIGIISGFKSRSTFYEAFKAETGMTPSQYLESL